MKTYSLKYPNAKNLPRYHIYVTDINFQIGKTTFFIAFETQKIISSYDIFCTIELCEAPNAAAAHRMPADGNGGTLNSSSLSSRFVTLESTRNLTNFRAVHKLLKISRGSHDPRETLGPSTPGDLGTSRPRRTLGPRDPGDLGTSQPRRTLGPRDPGGPWDLATPGGA